MKTLLQASKVLLTALVATLLVFALYMHFGAEGHAHGLGLRKLFTAAGLGLGSGLVAATTATIVTVLRSGKATVAGLKKLNLGLLFTSVVLVIEIVVTWR